MAQVDVSHRTVHKNSVLQTLVNLKQKVANKGGDLQTEVKKALVNRYVITD